MSRRKPAAMTAALAITCVLLGGCTSASGVNIETLDPATSTSTASSTAAASPSSSALQNSASQSSAVATASPAAGTDSGLPAGEAADRAAVESQWIKSWDVYAALAHTPGDQRAALAGTVAVDPALTNMLTDAQTLTGKGLDTYGQIAHRISWPQSVDGKPSAVIADCQDSSQSGSYETSTGYKRTVGVPRDHMQGILLRSDDGIWRVQQVFYLKDEPC